MNELELIFSVIGLFLLRIGLPVTMLVGLGIMIDHWQSKREANVRNQHK